MTMTLRNGKTLRNGNTIIDSRMKDATVGAIGAVGGVVAVVPDNTKVVSVDAPIHKDVGEFVKELQKLIIEQHKTRPGCVFDQLDALCDVYRYINQYFPSFNIIEKMSITKLINVINAKIPQHLASLIPLAHRYPDAKEFKKLEDASQILLVSANVMQNK